MALLPPRPLRLDARALARRRLKKTALSVFVGAVGVAFCVGCAFFARQLFEERRLWDRGAEGRVVHLSGQVEESQQLGLTFIYDYKLQVRWLDLQGRERNGPASFSRMFKGVPPGDAPGLRYDPSAPDRFVLSWAAQGGLPRDGIAILCGGLGLLTMLGSIGIVRGERRRLQALRMCAEDGEEVLGRVEKMRQYKGVHYVHYRFPDDTRVRKYQGDAPFLLTRDGVQQVLTLRSPRAPDAPFVVEADLRCFELSQDERERIGGVVQTISLTG
jgi:hypothetical protein